MADLIVSVSSDIGFAVGKDWKRRQHRVLGTYRNKDALPNLLELGVSSFHCDLAIPASVQSFLDVLRSAPEAQQVDRVVFAAGDLNPIGRFGDSNFSNWRESLQVNFVSQLEILHGLITIMKPGGKFMFFAGGGTNSAVELYSAYTISKIASIKVCELLAAEYPEHAFFSLGPGWVDTKIHEQTLSAGAKAGQNQLKTTKVLRGGGAVSMEAVVEAINSLMAMPGHLITGRNFSVAHDPIGQEALPKALLEDSNLFKLRREGNRTFLAEY
jgi:NAD(P)-dependent dehydrogenase (short-subunit alcohol dehydrogenase family)